MKYYFYHVSNPDEIKSGAKPIVIQIGPYVYKEFRKKENVIPIGDEELFYGQHITYFYDQGETEAQGCVNPLTNNSACSSRYRKIYVLLFLVLWPLIVVLIFF
jgi:hypothetical protein